MTGDPARNCKVLPAVFVPGVNSAAQPGYMRHAHNGVVCLAACPALLYLCVIFNPVSQARKADKINRTSDHEKRIAFTSWGHIWGHFSDLKSGNLAFMRVTGRYVNDSVSAKSEEKSLVNIKVARLFVFQEANWLA